MKKKHITSLFFILSIHTIALSSLIPNHFFVNFDKSMSRNRRYNKNTAAKNKDWQKLKSLFNEHIINNLKYAETPRIPKIIHQVWLGSNGNLPEQYKKFQKSWIEKHPDWQYILWTEKEIDAFGLKNRKLYDETNNYGVKSDIARYEILYRIGGLYVDTDFQCLKSFNVFHHICDFYAGSCMGNVEVMIGLIGAKPGHPILKECIENVQPKRKEKETAMDIIKRTGPQFFTKCFLRVMENYIGPAVSFPMTYFYPVSNEYCGKMPKNLSPWINKETFAVHHWGFSWNK